MRFGGNIYEKIKGEGMHVLDDGETKVENGFYAEGLKHNLL